VSTFRKALSDLGHNVFIFAQQHNGFEDEEPFIFRYPSLTLPVSVDIPAVIPFSPVIDRILPSLKLDVIHTHHPILLGQTAAKKAQELDLPLVFTFHTQYREYTHYVPLSHEAVQDFLKNAIHSWLRDFMRRCQHVIIPSESMRDILIHEYGLVGPYTVIPTGIELVPYQSRDREALRSQHGWRSDQIMISIGRLSEEKNWELLLQAMALSARDNPYLRLVLVGDGPMRQALEDLAFKLGIVERVEFIGEIPFDEVPSYLKAADFFVFASTAETQGLVILEAMAANLPVVAVAASGVHDVVQDQVQGLLVNNDPLDLAKGITQMLSDEQRFRKFRKGTKERVLDFEIKRFAGNLSNVYNQAKQDKKANRFVKVR
jgi:glycosyltransferase involved in cell wall biosynthesis